MATAATMTPHPGMAVANETVTSGTRFTQSGKKLTYKLEIIQQPERARACGSGAKSSADRRPVDPPPIVSLRVFEGDAENDITFNHNCNFALYASLENARPVAHGRTSGAPPPASAVLTGQPISGMSLLDRPKPAGYFIFPDLSVRHEGKYRLVFSLYEAPKERKDYPVITAENQEYANDHHLQFRVEVKSKVFTVFSAKKFPGLTESTQLSRVIAEQGCRVRIRRDVRMRRRGENQKRGDYDDYADKGEYDRARASATPDAYGHVAVGTPQADGTDRPRSVSDASNIGGYRPPSMDLAQSYPSQYASPVTPQAMYPNGQMQQWPQPPQSMGYMQPPPAPPAYPQQQPYQQQAQPVGAPYGGQFVAPQYSVPNGVSHTRNNSMEFPPPPTGPSQHISTPVSQYPAPPMQAMSPYTPTNFSRPLVQQSQPMQPPGQLHQLHPLQTHQPLQHPIMNPNAAYTSPPAHSPGSTAEHAVTTYAAVEPTTVTHQAHTSPISHMPVMTTQHNGYPNYLAAAPPPKLHMAPSASGATKRTFAATFDTEHMDGRMQQGARPNAQAEDVKGYAWDMATPGDDPNYYDDDSAPMLYRRADGTEKRRTVPFAH